MTEVILLVPPLEYVLSVCCCCNKERRHDQVVCWLLNFFYKIWFFNKTSTRKSTWMDIGFFVRYLDGTQIFNRTHTSLIHEIYLHWFHRCYEYCLVRNIKSNFKTINILIFSLSNFLSHLLMVLLNLEVSF